MSEPAADAGCWLDCTHAGDCRQLLKRMHEEGVRVQICVISPPYFGLRSYLQDGHPYTVHDPFMGSGTTAVAALRLQRHFIGCELNRSFIDLQHLLMPIGSGISHQQGVSL